MKAFWHQRLLTISALSSVLSANAQTSTSATTAAATTPEAACDSSEIILQGTCDPSLCDEYCNLYGSTYLSDKCCIHDGVNANLLAFKESATWIPRIEKFKKCSGANVKLQYVPGGEDNMAQALTDDVGLNNREDYRDRGFTMRTSSRLRGSLPFIRVSRV